MRHVLLFLAMVLAVAGGSYGAATARQIEIEVETKLLIVLEAEPADGAAVEPDLLAEATRTKGCRSRRSAISSPSSTAGRWRCRSGWWRRWS
jgi:hypothetical protein